MLKAPSFQPMLTLSLYQSTWFQISIINPKFHICLLWTPDLGAPTNTLFYSLQNRITLTPYPSQPSQSGPHEGFCLGDSVQVTAHVNSKLHIRLLGVSCSLLLPAGRGAERVSLSWWCLIHISSSAPVAHLHSQSNIVRWPTWPLLQSIFRLDKVYKTLTPYPSQPSQSGPSWGFWLGLFGSMHRLLG